MLLVTLKFLHPDIENKFQVGLPEETFIMMDARAHLPLGTTVDLEPMPEQPPGPRTLKLIGLVNTVKNNLQEKQGKERMKKITPILKRIIE